MNIEKLRTLLADRGLWLARLDQFGTKYEGMLPVPNQMGLLSMFPAPAADWLQREYQHGVQRSYAICWHARDGSPASEVWAEFDKPGQGVAVGVSYEELLLQLGHVASSVNVPPVGGDGPIHVGAVTYINHQTDSVPEGNVLEAQFVVRDKWSYQQELRVLVHTHGTAAYDRLYNKTGPFGQIVEPVLPGQSATGKTELVGGHSSGKALVLPIDPNRLVQRIIPNKAMSMRSRLELAKLAARTGMLCRVKWW